ncbi:hypothetical protein BDZ94DRAFT_1244073 [Collybia nuda]|uniref:Uncharacterized protein n=1 Tax=Collybia nuda TaxID=64659 RepID=A0A9P6CK63_9AGAR|nr:hypothetical protein BDZ94DRAFT_1244073 [Collybia nuda]
MQKNYLQHPRRSHEKPVVPLVLCNLRFARDEIADRERCVCGYTTCEDGVIHEWRGTLSESFLANLGPLYATQKLVILKTQTLVLYTTNRDYPDFSTKNRGPTEIVEQWPDV